jgi:hypothetical protein
VDCPYAELDVDDTSSYGPETITIAQRFNGTYTYAIYNYSGEASLTTSEAKIEIFNSSGLIASYDVPTSGDGRWWHVVDIDGATGLITEVNAIVATSPESYQDTTIPRTQTYFVGHAVKVTEILAAMFVAGRGVVAKHQGLINDPEKGDKGFTPEYVAGRIREQFKEMTGTDIDAVQPE